MIELYENIKKYRIEKKMSQAELAKQTGYTDRSSIAKIERGAVDLPQSKIILFAKALNVSAGELMGNTGIEDKSKNVITPDESYILDKYKLLNVTGKKKAREYISDLTENRKYTLSLNSHNQNLLVAAHERTDVDATDEQLQNDLDIMFDEEF